MTLKARVHAGRLVFDEPTDLPEGTEVQLLPLDPGDWLDDASRAALHQALRESELDVAAGAPHRRRVDSRGAPVRLRHRRVRFTATAREHVRGGKVALGRPRRTFRRDRAPSTCQLQSRSRYGLTRP